jgi:hypothetical protein
MRKETRWAVVLGMALALAIGMVQLGSARQMGSKAKSEKSEKTVYVCACKGDSSCPCMAMAKMEGKCPCGEHSPNMKAVSATSTWAKTNRKSME